MPRVVLVAGLGRLACGSGLSARAEAPAWRAWSPAGARRSRSATSSVRRRPQQGGHRVDRLDAHGVVRSGRLTPPCRAAASSAREGSGCRPRRDRAMRRAAGQGLQVSAASPSGSIRHTTLPSHRRLVAVRSPIRRAGNRRAVARAASRSSASRTSRAAASDDERAVALGARNPLEPLQRAEVSCTVARMSPKLGPAGRSPARTASARSTSPRRVRAASASTAYDGSTGRTPR